MREKRHGIGSETVAGMGGGGGGYRSNTVYVFTGDGEGELHQVDGPSCMHISQAPGVSLAQYISRRIRFGTREAILCEAYRLAGRHFGRR